jgi:hypothetical protein
VCEICTKIDEAIAKIPEDEEIFRMTLRRENSDEANAMGIIQVTAIGDVTFKETSPVMLLMLVMNAVRGWADAQGMPKSTQAAVFMESALRLSH